MINHVAKGNARTIDVVPVANITAPAFAFEGTLAVFYTRDATAGQPAAADAFDTAIYVEKVTQATVINVGDAVNLDVAEQKTGGATRGGVCTEKSDATMTHVKVRLNS